MYSYSPYYYYIKRQYLVLVDTVEANNEGYPKQLMQNFNMAEHICSKV